MSSSSSDRGGDDNDINNSNDQALFQAWLSQRNPPVDGCFCCGDKSLEFDTERIRRFVLPLAPPDDYDIPWDVHALPAETNSSIPSFFILKRVFLFLPLDMQTLLAAASTCHSWRAVMDRHPAWRYILPMRHEVFELVSKLRWDLKPMWQREYFTATTTERQRLEEGRAATELHYRMRPSAAQQFKIRAAITKRACCRSSLRGVHRVLCCGDSDSDCDCSSCSCSSSEDDNEMINMQDNKRKKFLSEHNNTEYLAQHGGTAEDAELAKYAFAPHRRAVDWARRLGRMRHRTARHRDEVAEGGRQHSSNNNDDDENNNDTHRLLADDPKRYGTDESALLSPAARPAAVNNNIDDDDDDSANNFQQEISMQTQDSLGPDDKPTMKAFDPNKTAAVINFIHASDHIPRNEFKNYTYELMTRPIRAQRQTLVLSRREIMRGVSYRRQWLVPSLSSFTSATRESIAKFKEHGALTCSEVYSPYWWTVFVCLIVLALCTSAGALLGKYIRNTDFTLSDIYLGRSVILITVPFTIIAMFGLQIYLFSALDGYRGPSLTKASTLVAWTVVVCFFSTPLSLLAFRVEEADLLLKGGSVSVTSLVADLFENSSRVAFFIEKKTKQQQDESAACHLPPDLLPSRIAAATFVEFPPGTRFIYHPPNLPRRVPLAARRGGSGEECFVERNATILPFDAGHNQSKTDIDRSQIGYYTVVFPTSSSDSFANTTFLIIGDYNDCPFWSADRENHTYFNKTLNATLPKPGYVSMRDIFDNILENTTAEDAISNASVYAGEEIAEALLNKPQQPPCGSANNSMVIVREWQPPPAGMNASRKDFVPQRAHRFYLRVATGFQPHWTASYYRCRQPCDDAPWDERRSWIDTLDYKLNGIVALTADSDMLVAHLGKTDPQVPEIFSPWPTAHNDWSDDNGSAPFWTAAHPAGVRKLRDDFRTGFTGLFIFCGSVIGVSLFGLFWFRGFTRWVSAAVAWMSLSQFFMPIALLIVTSSCMTNGYLVDSSELRQPVMCLSASTRDMLGYTILFGVIGCLYSLGLVYVFASLWCDDDDCCEDDGICCCLCSAVRECFSDCCED